MNAENPAPDRAREPGEFQPKLIYLARRNPTLSRTAFVARWRRHGALGMSLPRWRNIARYVHCDVLESGDATAGLATQYDGVGLIWHRSREARAAHVADTDSRLQMEADEHETFAEPVVNFCLLARETALIALPRPPAAAAVKLTRFLRAHDRGAAAALPARRLSEAASLQHELRAAGAGPLGHVVNAPLPPERGAGWGLASDCVEEFWFGTVDAALRAGRVLAAGPGRGLGSADEPIDATTVLTNEVLLYEA